MGNRFTLFKSPFKETGPNESFTEKASDENQIPLLGPKFNFRNSEGIKFVCMNCLKHNTIHKSNHVSVCHECSIAILSII